MNHRLDLNTYDERKGSIEATRLDQKRALHTHVFKLPSIEPNLEYLEIAIDFFDAGQFEKSIFPLKRTIIIDPFHARPQRMLAEAFLNLRKEKECLSTIKRALSFSPGEDILHRFLIETLAKLNKLEGLEGFYKEIAETIEKPRSLSVFYFESGEALVFHKKTPQALASYKKAVECNSRDYYHHYNYGLALYKEGFFEEAIVQFEIVKNIDATVRLAWNNVAHLHYCLGRVEKAREEFEYIIANGLEAHVTYSNFLLLLHHLGENEEVFNKYKDLFQPYVISHGYVLPRLYKEELRITEAILQREDIDEKTKEFNIKKIEGINLVLSFFPQLDN